MYRQVRADRSTRSRIRLSVEKIVPLTLPHLYLHDVLQKGTAKIQTNVLHSASGIGSGENPSNSERSLNTEADWTATPSAAVLPATLP